MFIDIFIFIIIICIIDYVWINVFVFVVFGESVFLVVFIFNINGNFLEKDVIKVEMKIVVSFIYFKFKRF